MNQINVKHIANLNNDCLRGIEFYKQELGILQERLEEIASKNSAKEVIQQVDHFQNQFLVHENYFDELQHIIHNNDVTIEAQVLKTGVFINEDTAVEHESIQGQYETEEKIFNDLRHEFNRIAAKWM
jgi:hypothetical protein